LFSFGRTAIAALSALLLCASVEHVDSAPAVALGDSWYAAVGVRHPFVAIDRFYSGEFLQQAPDWPASLIKIERTGGPVTKATLTASRMTAKADAPCYLLDYEVVRPAGTMQETLFVCREGEQGKPWRIYGHAMRRPDTGKSIQAGVMPVEAGVCVGTNCPS
jgi:hypothetical protein